MTTRCARACSAPRRRCWSIIGGLAEAHRAHHDLLWTLGDLAADLRHRIEGQTFTPDTGEPGVQLVDAAAAPFGSFDAMHLVGLVDGEWPRRQRRNIFYSPGAADRAGLAGRAPRRAGARTRGVRRPVAVADRARVGLDVLARRRRAGGAVEPARRHRPRGPDRDSARRARGPCVPGRSPRLRRSRDRRLRSQQLDAMLAEAIDGEAAQWAALRASRTAATLPRFHGAAGPQPPRARSVSALELYAQCPFKFYSRYVLRLAEERDDDEALSPLERGRMHHELFEAIFAAWQSRGHGTVTPELLDQARTLALETMEAHLARLSPVDAALERTRLVGSPVAPGLIDVVLRLEAERPTAGRRTPARTQDRRRSIASAAPTACARSKCGALPIGSTCWPTAPSACSITRPAGRARRCRSRSTRRACGRSCAAIAGATGSWPRPPTSPSAATRPWCR